MFQVMISMISERIGDAIGHKAMIPVRKSLIPVSISMIPVTVNMIQVIISMIPVSQLKISQHTTGSVLT